MNEAESTLGASRAPLATLHHRTACLANRTEAAIDMIRSQIDAMRGALNVIAGELPNSANGNGDFALAQKPPERDRFDGAIGSIDGEIERAEHRIDELQDLIAHQLQPLVDRLRSLA